VGSKVVVIASGLTEREALPHLTRHLSDAGVSVVDVRIPPRNRPLIPRLVQDLIKAVWWETYTRGDPPDKFVVLIDADGKPPEALMSPFREACDQLQDITARRLVAAVQWHLEAWFFAHAESLRSFLGKSLGAVDPSAPDAIINPKLHSSTCWVGPTHPGRLAKLLVDLLPRLFGAEARASRSLKHR
jgi:hypothetical protein